MIFKQINSSVVIFNIIDKYAVESEDFTTRSPLWIKDCLDDMKLSNTTTPETFTSEFSNGRIQLPIYYKSIDWVLIDGRKADYNESLYLLSDDSGDTSSNIYLPFYRISNGWLHSNIVSGSIEIKYKKILAEFDDIVGLEFPLIPDEYNVKEAITCFILKTMIMRGYVHPLLNIRENNPITNPALGYEKHKALAKIYCGRPTLDAREKYNYPLASLFGRRKPLRVGKLNVVDTGNVPPPVQTVQHRVAFCFDQTYQTPTELTYVENKNIPFKNVIIAEFRYLFISIPNDKTFKIYNALDIDISDQFVKGATDEVAEYQLNDVYKMSNQFYTGVYNNFKLIIQ